MYFDVVANTVREETSSPVYTKESLAVRSDKQTEVVVYVISVCTLISFAPYVSEFLFDHLVFAQTFLLTILKTEL